MAEDPGRARPPDADTVRAALLHFANLIRRLEEEGALLRAIPLLLRRLGDLRQVLFDYEVRVTERLLPIEDPVERESRRVVRDASSRSTTVRRLRTSERKNSRPIAAMKVATVQESGEPIPAASTWGILVFTLLLSVAGTVVLRHTTLRQISH